MDDIALSFDEEVYDYIVEVALDWARLPQRAYDGSAFHDQLLAWSCRIRHRL